MSDQLRSPRPIFRRSFALFATLLAGFYWAVFLSFPEFFVFDPFQDAFWLRQLTLLLSIVAWFAISTVPALVLYLYVLGSTKWLVLLPIAALLWPLSVVLNQLLLLGRDGRVYFEYLLNFPVFIATDIALPALLTVLFFDLKAQSKKYLRLARTEVRSRPYS